MEYFYLPEHSRAIEREKLIKVIDEISSKNNVSIDLDEIFGDCQIYDEEDKNAVREFLLGRGIIIKKEIYDTSKDECLNVKEAMDNGSFDKIPLFDVDLSKIEPGHIINISYLQIVCSIGFPKAAKLFEILKNSRLVERDKDGNYRLKNEYISLIKRRNI